MKRVLQIVPNMQAGGLETFIMNIYREINKNEVQFDFLVHYKEPKFYDAEIEKMGGKIYRFSLRDNNNIFKYISELNKFYRNNKYDVIHCHMASIGFLNFLIAKKNGIKVRIAHSHNINTESNFKGLIKKIMIKPYKFLSTINLACSEEAGKFLFGKRKYTVISNGIDVAKFKFNENKRTEIRTKHNWENSFIIGHVGRFEKQKNHMFMLELIEKLSKINDKYKMVFIGDGTLKEEIYEIAKKRNLLNNIEFISSISNVEDYYCAMDCFILPSFFEGLGIVLIEAQSSGLKCIVSSNIPNEAYVTDLVSTIDLTKIDEWVTKIEDFSKNQSHNRDSYNTIVNKTSFSINKVAEEIKNIYLN